MGYLVGPRAQPLMCVKSRDSPELQSGCIAAAGAVAAAADMLARCSKA